MPWGTAVITSTCRRLITKSLKAKANVKVQSVDHAVIRSLWRDTNQTMEASRNKAPNPEQT